jgi:hypothetical protein
MSTIVYKGIIEGDWVVCSQCGKKMLLPYGADQCPECHGCGTLDWVDESNQEANIREFSEMELVHSEMNLKLEDYLDPETLDVCFHDYYEDLMRENDL